MIRRRFILALAAVVMMAASAAGSRGAAAAATPAATISSFYDTLLTTMKQGNQLGFAGRRDKLAPAIRQAFDLPLMTRLMVGPQWSGLTPSEQQDLVAAFSNFSIATYANRFDDYSGERFQVEPTPAQSQNGQVIVHSKLVKSDGQPVQLDYLMRRVGDSWKVIDVYLSGTVSELATRRSEFSSVLRRGGPAALVDVLQRKTAQLAG